LEHRSAYVHTVTHVELAHWSCLGQRAHLRRACTAHRSSCRSPAGQRARLAARTAAARPPRCAHARRLRTSLRPPSSMRPPPWRPPPQRPRRAAAGSSRHWAPGSAARATGLGCQLRPRRSLACRAQGRRRPCSRRCAQARHPAVAAPAAASRGAAVTGPHAPPAWHSSSSAKPLPLHTACHNLAGEPDIAGVCIAQRGPHLQLEQHSQQGAAGGRTRVRAAASAAFGDLGALRPERREGRRIIGRRCAAGLAANAKWYCTCLGGRSSNS